MDDILEKYVSDHRDEFEELEPSNQTWTSIEGRLKPKRRYDFLWKVAAMLFLASTIYLIVDRNYSQEEDQEASLVKSEFYEAERYYFSLISQKKSLLKDLNVEERNYDLMEEEEVLDQRYEKLKRDYLKQNSNQQVRDAMIQNLRMRIKILSDQIEVLSQINNEETDETHTEI